ncbi:hypothetical protein SDC9_118491 [bioreactor metagenome]|uniref:Uncharacterized protein n=1 Tax=bioreactor metagenome TaxID=1076179 RepID=A0A645C137_9ZZZZ|nr:hypothetical protein [Candidatus Metalachnospira sp.]
MSVQTLITSLTASRNTIRTKLVALGLVTGTSKLEDCATAINNMVNNGAVTGTISTKEGVYTVPAGFHNGTGTVGIVSTEKDKVIAGNIKTGVTMLGVLGTYNGPAIVLQPKTVTPTEASQNVTADEGYDGLSTVTVNPIPDNYADISEVTAVAGDVLANKVFVDSTGAQGAGTMVNNGAIAATIDGLTATLFTVPAGYHSGLGTVSLTSAIETALAAI